MTQPNTDTDREAARASRQYGRGATRALKWFIGANVTVALLALIALLSVAAGVLPALAETPAAAGVVADQVKMWGYVAAALSTCIGALGAAYAVSHVGSAALGAMGERPELAGRALIFVGLAEGIAIYGLIVSIMILSRVG